MNTQEAKTIPNDKLKELRAKPYQELCRLLETQELREIKGQSGTVYQLEVQAMWDAGTEAKRDLRVMASIDDGGWRAFMPLTADFIMASDGSFIGE